jgi:hypothetical protein
MKTKKVKQKKSLPLVEVIKDLRNYRSWIQVIRNESSKANSKFNKYDLSHNYFYVLYVAITLPQEDSALPENIKRLRVMESLSPINWYLDVDLGFADYIIPEFNQFYDKENEPTLTYGIVYRFAFKRLSLKWILTRGFAVGFLTWALIKWPIISTLLGLIGLSV